MRRTVDAQPRAAMGTRSYYIALCAGAKTYPSLGTAGLLRSLRAALRSKDVAVNASQWLRDPLSAEPAGGWPFAVRSPEGRENLKLQSVD